jgi:preprotein translocase subunit SecE
MARLQRKKSPSEKKKPASAVTPAPQSEQTPAAATPGSDSAKTEVKKPVPAPRRNLTAAKAKGESEGKLQGWWSKSIQFLREVKVELKKVTWPSRKQTLGTTAVVLTLVFIVSAFLGVVDMVLSGLVRLILPLR